MTVMHKYKALCWNKVRAIAIGLITFGLVALGGILSVDAAAKDGIRILIVAGGSSHDFGRWYGKVDRETLERNGLAVVTYTEKPDEVGQYLPNTDVLYLANNQPFKSVVVRKAIFDFVAAGKGLVIGHAANWYNWPDWPEYNAQLVGGGTNDHDQYGQFRVNILDAVHPVMRGIRSFDLSDERYHYESALIGSGIEVLTNSGDAHTQALYPSVFVVKHPRARIVGITLGHDGGAHELPQYQQILRQAVEWAAHRK